MDLISQNKGSTGKRVSFYLGEKENKKGRRFHMFEVDLLGTEGGMGGEALEKHIDKTINNLLNTMY